MEKTKVKTKVNFDIVNIKQVSKAIKQSGINTGAVVLYNWSGEHAH